MEFSLQNNDKSERIRCSSEEQAQVKSYTCGFCKRGFSNAQALGGHMNIHRKDRAKLRQQSSEENLLSLDISIKNPHENVETNNNHKQPSIFPEAKVNIDISSEISQFPIFVGRARGDYNISNEIITASNSTSVVVKGIEENKMELDLELRLGPERVQETAPTLRQFF